MPRNYRLKQLILLTGDLLSFWLGLIVALTVRFWLLPDNATILRHAPLFLLLFIFWVVINYINGLYDAHKIENSLRFFRRWAEAGIAALLISIVFFYLADDSGISPKTILALAVVLGYSLGAGWRWLFNRHIGEHSLRSNVLFVGYSADIGELCTILAKHNGYTVRAIVDPDAPDVTPTHIRHSNTLRDLRNIIAEEQINLVVISPHLEQEDATTQELYRLLFLPVVISDTASFYEHVTGRIPPSTFSDGWFLHHLRHTDQPVYEHLRTIADYLVGAILGIITLIALPFIALAIRLNSPGPIFFTQERVGKGGKPFTLYKFRSMQALSKDGSAETGNAQFASKNDVRITSVGKFLRKTRLDELPQSWNLLKRDVTLIGPRPERPEIVEKMVDMMPYYNLRSVVRPGLTGWAVLHQHYADTLEKNLQKLQYDLFYIKNRSLVLDLSIVLRTVNVVIRGLGQ